MGKLELTYAWSESRVRCLRECRWRYFLTYYMAWEGWLANAPQEKRRAYMLKNMTNFPMYVGSVVHNVIEDVITVGRKTGQWKPLKEAQDDGIQALRKGWVQSIEKRWQARPKGNANFAEHFYQEEIDPKRLASYKYKVLASIKAFYDCPLFVIMQNLDSDDWLTIEDFQRFTLNTGEEVTVKIDCGFRYLGKVYLIDWKTGKVSDSVIDQLTTYAMYAVKQGWVTKPDDIVIIPAYLAAYANDGEKALPHLTVTMQHLMRQANIIRNEYPLLIEAHQHRDDPDYFEHTDNERACSRC